MDGDGDSMLTSNNNIPDDGSVGPHTAPVSSDNHNAHPPADINQAVDILFDDESPENEGVNKTMNGLSVGGIMGLIDADDHARATSPVAPEDVRETTKAELNALAQLANNYGGDEDQPQASVPAPAQPAQPVQQGGSFNTNELFKPFGINRKENDYDLSTIIEEDEFQSEEHNIAEAQELLSSQFRTNAKLLAAAVKKRKSRSGSGVEKKSESAPLYTKADLDAEAVAKRKKTNDHYAFGDLDSEDEYETPENTFHSANDYQDGQSMSFMDDEPPTEEDLRRIGYYKETPVPNKAE